MRFYNLDRDFDNHTNNVVVYDFFFFFLGLFYKTHATLTHVPMPPQFVRQTHQKRPPTASLPLNIFLDLL